MFEIYFFTKKLKEKKHNDILKTILNVMIKNIINV